MGTTAPTSRIWLLMTLGYAMAGMVGCGDNGMGGDDNVASGTAAITVSFNTCPATTPPSDIFVKKAGVIIVNATNADYKEIEFAGDGRPICFRGIPIPFELSPIFVRFAPTNVYVSMEGSIGQCGLYPDDRVPILSADRTMGSLLTAPCGPNNSQSGQATCILPRLTAEDFNHCLR